MTHQLRSLLAVGFLALATLIPAAQPAGTLAGTDAENEASVHAFVEAFNERDLDGILALVHEDVEWLSVAGAQIAVESKGNIALAEGLESYFKACPSCRSDLEWVQSAGSRVVAFERASWTAGAEERSQVSLAVYEFEDGAIRRVYYHPAEALPEPEEKPGEGDGK